MSIFTEISLGALVLFIAFLFFLLARNESVYRARMAFIDDDYLYPDAFKSLPGYSEMCDHPKHYLRWTKQHWIDYVMGPK